eukprot:8842015-Pyramimonas_sp.AAC.1
MTWEQYEPVPVHQHQSCMRALSLVEAIPHGGRQCSQLPEKRRKISLAELISPDEASAKAETRTCPHPFWCLPVRP